MNKAYLLILFLFQLLINKTNDWKDRGKFFFAKCRMGINNADLLILFLFQLFVNKTNDLTGKDRFFLAKIFVILIPPFVVLFFMQGISWIYLPGAKILPPLMTIAFIVMVIENTLELFHVKAIERRGDAPDEMYRKIMGVASSHRFFNLTLGVFGCLYVMVPGDVSRPMVIYGVIFLLYSSFFYVLSCTNSPGHNRKKLVPQTGTLGN